jgi:hypothetical protein
MNFWEKEMTDLVSFFEGYSSDCLKYGLSNMPSFSNVNEAAEHLIHRALWIGDKLILQGGKHLEDHAQLLDGASEYSSVRVSYCDVIYFKRCNSFL